MIAQELNTHTIKLTRKKGPRTAKKIAKRRRQEGREEKQKGSN